MRAQLVVLALLCLEVKSQDASGWEPVVNMPQRDTEEYFELIRTDYKCLGLTTPKSPFLCFSTEVPAAERLRGLSAGLATGCCQGVLQHRYPHRPLQLAQTAWVSSAD